MNSRRTLKAASAIREVVSLAILTELRDPRVKNVTVTFVEISRDMRNAKIHVSIMGSEKEQDLCMHGLNRSAGFLQKRVHDRVDTRYTPRLQFMLDKGVKHAFKVAEILDDVLPPDENNESANAQITATNDGQNAELDRPNGAESSDPPRPGEDNDARIEPRSEN